MINLGRDILEEFAAFGSGFDHEDHATMSVHRQHANVDSLTPHREADAFIAAGPAERERLVALYLTARAARVARAVSASVDVAPSKLRRRGLPGVRLAPHEETRIHELRARGFSVRAIEKLTGITRAAITKRLTK